MARLQPPFVSCSSQNNSVWSAPLPTGISKLCGAQESLGSRSGSQPATEVAKPPTMVTEGQQGFVEAAPQQTHRSTSRLKATTTDSRDTTYYRPEQETNCSAPTAVSTSSMKLPQLKEEGIPRCNKAKTDVSC